MTTLETYAAEVVALVCKRHGIKPADLLARTYRDRQKWRKGTRTDPKAKPCGHTKFKSKPYADARSDAVRILRSTVTNDECIYRLGGVCVSRWPKCAPLSYPAIGRLLGMHHTTAILAERRGMKCKRCDGRGASNAGLRSRPSMMVTCPACSATGKKPPLTWDAYTALTSTAEAGIGELANKRK